jgi:flagellar biosynthetic protein FliR/FlhB
LLLSLPVVIALLAINLAFGVMSRAAPQLNIITIGFPVTILAGIMVVSLTLDDLRTTSVARVVRLGVHADASRTRGALSMAEQNDAEDRTEQATEKRQHEAREKGQIARSRELTTVFVLVRRCASPCAWRGPGLMHEPGRGHAVAACA